MKNWTIKEAVAVIRTGTDQEAIKELAKHFPMFFIAVAQNDLGALAAMMTDKMTVRRLEAGNGSEDSDGADEETAVAESEQDDADGDVDLNELSTKQLITLCGKRGIKVPKYGKNKAFYIAALENGTTGNGNNGGDEDDADEDPYRGKNALQLYSMCKKRNLKVEPRQKAIVYLEALKAADAANADDAEDDDEAEEEVKPAKPAKKAAPKKTAPKPKKEEAKPAKSESDDDDDDDDWDI